MAQFFKTATIPQTTYQKNPGPTPFYQLVENTGNDMFVETVNNITYELSVTVWDGFNPSMGWKYIDNTGTYTSIVDLPTEVIDPDVCILHRNSDWYVAICYRDGSSGLPKLQIQKFDVPTKTWSVTATHTLGNGQPVQSAINIDSDQHEHYFVVWDQLNVSSNVKIYGASGIFNGVNVTLCLASYEFPAFYDPSGVNLIQYPYNQPDVAIMDFPWNNGTNPGQVKVSFLGGPCAAYPGSTHTLAVTDEVRFTKWGVCTFTPPSGAVAYARPELTGYEFGWPRIARHRRNTNITDVQEGFTVVYQKHQPNAHLYDIAGLTVFYDYTTTPGVLILTDQDNTYTDGNAQFYGTGNPPSLPPINTTYNLKPVVSYELKSGTVDPNAKQIMCIAFEHADVNTPLHRFCASFYAHNYKGRPYTDPAGTPNYLFYHVPTNVNEHTYAISVAGEMSESFIYSFANFTNQSVQYKTVASFAHLRQGNFMTASAPTPKSVLLYDNFTPMFFSEIESDMTWADAQGKVICNDISNANEVLLTLKPGITFMNYKTHEGYTQQVKLIKL